MYEAINRFEAMRYICDSYQQPLYISTYPQQQPKPE